MSTFDRHVASLPLLHAELINSSLHPLKPQRDWAGKKAIYIFYENGSPCHVGRTRNLGQRVRGHLSNSHYSASFAFARARKKLGLKPSYRKGEGRAALMLKDDFLAAFHQERQCLADMQIRFLEVGDPIAQFLLELYTALELGTSLDEFETS